ncbi:hypothetical protein MTR67_034935 [Solanum verrucosum]|uniref:Tf2-1-like SH3-like domain-containing protein n=1 Tax=Solanum verrucosum TaxID=315347 RepID=A0AAF0U9A5_SOLVR|nr:hypothetical protein MTR67_034935 [Solanum verrucosum]
MGDPSLIIPTEELGIKDNLSYEDIPVQILDHQVRKLKTKEVASVKVFWRNHLLRKLLGRLRELEFQVDDWVFLKVSPLNGVMRFGKKGKLSPRYVGPYRILKRIASVVPLETVAVKDRLSYEDVPIENLDHQVRRLRNKKVASVKVWWRSQSVEGAIWETETAMKANEFAYSWNSVQSEIQFSVLSGATHGWHPRTVSQTTARASGSLFTTTTLPKPSSENRLSLDPLPDRPTVYRSGMIRGLCLWIQTPLPASNTDYGRPALTVVQCMLYSILHAQYLSSTDAYVHYIFSCCTFRFSASKSRLDRFSISSPAESVVSPHSPRTIVMSLFSIVFLVL